jgi:hypothetical protein
MKSRANFQPEACDSKKEIYEQIHLTKCSEHEDGYIHNDNDSL